MKYLEIKENKGFLLNEKGVWIELDQISKEDILFVVDRAFNEEDFAMDDFNEEDLKNPAHRIIYKQLHEKISDFIERKSALKDEISSMYEDAYNKYVDNTKK